VTVAAHSPSAPARPRRVAGTDGTALVAGIVLIFAFTFLGLVWLARDVDRGISNRSAAQSIAFQAARAGAQATSIGSLRDDAEIRVDPDAARRAAVRTARSLLASYELDGAVSEISVDADRVSVTVTVTDAGITVVGAGTVTAERAP